MGHENYIRTHVYSIPGLIQEQSDTVYDKIQKVFPKEELKNVEKIVMTGCGYSYAAGLTAKYFFETIAKVPAEIPSSIDASRHMECSILPTGRKTLFIGVSNSGIVARVGEALERFRSFGAMTAVFTGDPDSECARHGDYIVDVSCPDLEYSLPLRGYIMTLLNCYSIAWSIAEAKGIAGEQERVCFFQELQETASELKVRLPRIEMQVNEFAGLVKDSKAYEFIGSGMEYGAAWMGRQQTVGQTGKSGVDCSTEDWLHSNFFWDEPEKIGTLLFMPKRSPSYSREKEAARYMLYLKRPLCIITDLEEGFEGGAYLIHVPYRENALLNPVVDLIPISLFAGRICELTGEEYSRGFRNHWDFAKGGAAAEFSEICIVR